MSSISLQKLDKDRQAGFRPGIVCCIVWQKQLLVFYKKDYGIWLLPQGGIENKETAVDAFVEEFREELGEGLLKNCKKDLAFIGEGEIKFSPTSKAIRELHTDEGEKCKMIGKKYYFFVVETLSADVAISETDFDDFVWASAVQAKFLFDKNYQTNKRELTLNALEQLTKRGLVE
jgi:8-oxo-dGTP pyrophosphatase MutT (NUDIX family)